MVLPLNAQKQNTSVSVNYCFDKNIIVKGNLSDTNTLGCNLFILITALLSINIIYQIVIL